MIQQENVVVKFVCESLVKIPAVARDFVMVMIHPNILQNNANPRPRPAALIIGERRVKA